MAKQRKPVTLSTGETLPARGTVTLRTGEIREYRGVRVYSEAWVRVRGEWHARTLRNGAERDTQERIGDAVVTVESVHFRFRSPMRNGAVCVIRQRITGDAASEYVGTLAPAMRAVSDRSDRAILTEATI